VTVTRVLGQLREEGWLQIDSQRHLVVANLPKRWVGCSTPQHHQDGDPQGSNTLLFFGLNEGKLSFCGSVNGLRKPMGCAS